MAVAYDRGYDYIKDLSKAEGVPIPELLVLARQNDPFFAGSPAQVEQAQWFAGLWRRFSYSTGVHLRRVHYQLVSQPDARMPNGEKYENTENCWNFLCNAGKAARYLGLVNPLAFEDRRNPNPNIFARPRAVPQPGLDKYLYFYWDVPQIPTDLGEFSWEMPSPEVSGYDYSAGDQPVHVELWVEKSTMDDVLSPLCKDLGVNYVTSLGFQSITSIIGMLQRVQQANRPARIFYISDYDPAGDGMPTAVARQIEYWLSDYAGDADIRLQPLVLTKDQVIKYRLPSIPIKDTDRRKGAFIERYGMEATELDALEALHPGELARIVRQAVRPYRDNDYTYRLREVRQEAEESVRNAWEAETDEERDELADLESEAKEIVERYHERLVELAEAMESDLAGVTERLNNLKARVREKAEVFEPELPERPEPEIEGDDPDTTWLFDSSRDYMDQLEIYKARKRGEDLN